MSVDVQACLEALAMAGNAVHAKAHEIINDVPFLTTIGTLYAPFILLSFTAYTLSSKAGLRYYIALQQAPTISASKLPAKVKRAAIVLVLFFFFTVFFLAFYLSQDAVVRVGLLFLVTVHPIREFVGNALGLLTYSAHRTSNGGYQKRLVKERSTHRRLLNTFAILAAVGTVATTLIDTRVEVLSWMAFASWVYAISGSQSGSNIRFIYFATIYALLAFGITQLNLQLPNTRTVLMQAIRKIKADGDIFSWYYWSWIIPAFYASMPGVILSMMLRFDYQKHLEANPEASELSSLEVVPLRDDESSIVQKLLGAGVVVPRWAPRGFKKTYYRTAFAGWFLGHFLVLLSYVVWKVPNEHDIPAVNVMMQMVPVSVDIMLLFVFIVAIFKRDLNKLARYKEMWKLKPIPATPAQVEAALPPKVDEKEILIVIEEEKVEELMA